MRNGLFAGYIERRKHENTSASTYLVDFIDRPINSLDRDIMKRPDLENQKGRVSNDSLVSNSPRSDDNSPNIQIQRDNQGMLLLSLKETQLPLFASSFFKNFLFLGIFNPSKEPLRRI